MCRRFALDLDWDAAARLFDVDDDGIDAAALPAPSYDFAPRQRIALVAQGRDGRRYLTGAHWSLIPRHSMTFELPYPTYNARVESAGSKPTFAESTRHMRAIIPATGYYEWHGRRPFYFHAPDFHAHDGTDASGDSPDNGSHDGTLTMAGTLAMAGLYSWWRDPAGGPWRLTATIVTCPAVDGPSTVHDRMPMLVPADMTAAWLNPTIDGNTLLEPVRERGTDLSRRLRFHEVAPLPEPEASPHDRSLIAPLIRPEQPRLF
ncbi:SOS response-associated peptidase [Bifidobacterium simiarum]|uniref:Abasic site processing protein n=1 Tax=Bifidobacterium simiarum TaxID=2045441 RepID=A0A2M9HDS9_9BIFI|nr:SOS response-associated peptidase [Bifidobacterium simiarum]PJM74973.1 DUF159 family protein [Bifidobacterium simiarum]